MKLRPEALARRARELAISEGITIGEAYKELGRHAAKRKEKQLSIQPTLPVVLTKEAPKSNARLLLKGWRLEKY